MNNKILYTPPKNDIIKTETHKFEKMVDTPYNVISIALSSYKSESRNTYENYKRVISDFFMITTGKEVRELTREDISSINPAVITYYQKVLKDRGNNNRTISTKMSILKSMALWFERSKYDIRSAHFQGYNKLKFDVTDRGSVAFTEEEIYAMIEKAKEYDNDGRQSFLIRMAFITGMRKEAILKLKRENFEMRDGKPFCWAYDKGKKKTIRPIKIDDYNKAMELTDKHPKSLLYPTKNDPKKSVYPKYGDRLINRLKKDLNIKSQKKTFHSIRKSSTQWVYNESGGNILVAKEHANHSNIETTMQHYLRNNDKESSILRDIIDNEGVSSDKQIKSSTKNDLIEAILMCEDLSVLRQINYNLKKIKEKK